MLSVIWPWSHLLSISLQGSTGLDHRICPYKTKRNMFASLLKHRHRLALALGIKRCRVSLLPWVFLMVLSSPWWGDKGPGGSRRGQLRTVPKEVKERPLRGTTAECPLESHCMMRNLCRMEMVRWFAVMVSKQRGHPCIHHFPRVILFQLQTD